MSSSESDPLLSRNPRVGNNPRADEHSSYDMSTPRLELPTSFQIFDVSEDNKFLALVDDNFRLQAYELNNFEDHLQIQRQTIKDIPCEIKCKNPICVYLSVASGTGHVALSFLQMDEYREALKKSSWFDDFAKFKIYRKNDNEEEQEQQQCCNGEEELNLDKNYATCRVYRKNGEEKLERPFQGRAVFTKDGLVLIGRWDLEVYEAETLQKMYSFKSGSFYLDNYADFHKSSGYPPHTSYRKYSSQIRAYYSQNEGYGIASVSAYIRNGVIAVYDETVLPSTTGSVKIWSIKTGSLIFSFMRVWCEFIVAVSEDHRFLVTVYRRGSILKIYCMNSGTLLHTYESKGSNGNPSKSSILLVKLMEHQDYLLIMGTTSEQNGDSYGSKHLFLEILSIPQKKMIKYVEINTHFDPESVFAIDILQKDYFPNPDDPDALVYFPAQYFGVFLEQAKYVNQTVDFKTVRLIDPEPNALTGEKLWGEFSCNWKRTGKWKPSEYSKYDPHLDSDNNITLYLLEKGAHKFVLQFSTFAMQLWQLNPAEEEEEGPFNFGNEESSSNGNREELNYYGDTKNSTLIYTRGYYGLSSLDVSSRLVLTESIACGMKSCRPYIHFTDDDGRILVYVNTYAGGRIVDEMFLPMTELMSIISPDPILMGALDIYNITEEVTKDHFHSIESCLLSLIHTCWSDPTGYITQWDQNLREIISMNLKTLSRYIDTLSNDTKYFQTISASKSLMELAYYEGGQEIIEAIISKKEFSISIFNHIINENILTVLIKNGKLDLFQILFNQVILDHHNGHSVDLFPLIDALLCLQEKQSTGLLLECIDNLSYLPVDLSKKGLLELEIQTLGDQKSFNNFTAFHQMKKYNSGTLLFYVDKIMRLIRPRNKEIELVPTYYTENYFISNQICLIPLPTPRIYDAVSYAILAKDSTYSSRIDTLDETCRVESPIIEVLLAYRWRGYIKGPFYFLLLIHIVYYIFYTVAISFPEEIFGYSPGSSIQHHSHLVCLVIALLTWILLLLEEVKQMITLKWEYWKSSYNYIDLLAIIFPLVTFVLLITDGPHLYDISSLTTLILWLHFILRLRANRRIGILIEIIIQLSIKIAPIIGLMILLIFAFTHSFAVLLRRQDDSFFQEQFEGDAVPDNGSTLESSIALSDQSQQNLFKDPFLAFTTVWFFLYGIFDPIFSGDVGNYPMALFLAILFSFITALVILNVVIALMTGAIDETEKKGNRNWHVHLADVSNEVESLLGQFIKKESEPFFLYYHASNNDIERQHKKIENETKKLKERLTKRRETREWMKTSAKYFFKI